MTRLRVLFLLPDMRKPDTQPDRHGPKTETTCPKGQSRSSESGGVERRLREFVRIYVRVGIRAAKAAKLSGQSRGDRHIDETGDPQ